MTKTQSKRKTAKKTTVVLIAFIFLIVGIFIFRFFNPSLGFTYYEPSYLPPNISIMAKRISITPLGKDAELNFRTTDWVYSIEESKVDSSIGTAEQNYNPTSITPTCSIFSSTAKQQYRLCHWIDYGSIDVHQVVFIKDRTYILSDIPTGLKQPISIAEISKYVDSFKRKNTVGMPVLRSNF